MTSRMRRTIPTIVAGSLGIGATFASAAEPTQQELMSQIEQLKEKVAALETKQVTAADVDATVSKVLSDADKRSQLMATDGSFIAGYDNQEQKFVLRNADNSFSLSPGIHYQLRNITNYRDEAKNGGNSDTQNGFELRRVKLELSGTMFTPDMTYFIQWNTDRSDGGVFLEDAWVRYMFAPEWGLRVGQFKDPFSHEELTSDKKILGVDRSMMNQLLFPGGGGATRVQGATLIYGGYNKDNPLNVEGGITDGAGSFDTNFQDDANGEDWGGAVRAEYKLMGDWKQYADQSARGNKEDLLVLGAGGDVTDFTGDTQYSGMVDAQWENASGLGVYGAGIVQYNSFHGGGDSTNYGALLQVGYALNNKWEIFGRGDCTWFDGDINGEDTFPELSIGVNYFCGPDGSFGHRCKITVEADWLPNGAPSDLTGIGYLANPGENEFVLKCQFQFYL